MNSLKQKLQHLLSPAGIELNGCNPWDPQIHDERFYTRVLSKGSIGLGEAYMDKWYDIAEPAEFFCKLLRHRVDESKMTWNNAWLWLRSSIANMQTRKRSMAPIHRHYNLSPELYLSFLDPYNQYTCCYFPKGTETLEEAAVKKLDLICQKLQLKAGDRVLDIGCGWGGFARFAAEKYGCTVTGVSISEEQLKYARTACAGLPITFLNCDYRDLKGEYDKVLICGMIEHVGYKNYRTIMEVAQKNLVPDGIFLLHTIGRNESTTYGDPWIDKYIFPNHMLPSIRQIGGAAEGLFTMEDWHNMGAHYDHTLMAWHSNFVANWDTLKTSDKCYDERFYRMWTYYLLSCAGAFRARRHQLWQIVFTKQGMTGGYTTVR